jgi:hypothetical protein
MPLRTQLADLLKRLLALVCLPITARKHTQDLYGDFLFPHFNLLRA